MKSAQECNREIDLRRVFFNNDTFSVRLILETGVRKPQTSKIPQVNMPMQIIQPLESVVKKDPSMGPSFIF